MKKEELYKVFSHYEALSKDSCTHAQRVEIYRLMERSGVGVPEDTDARLGKGKFPFTCDFFVSKHPTAHIIKWVPTRSTDKKSKFTYKHPDYFLDILRGLSHVRIDPTNTILEDQSKHVGDILAKVQHAKLLKEEENKAIVSALANEVHGIGTPMKGHVYDDEPISFHVSMAPPPPVIPEEDDLPF